LCHTEIEDLNTHLATIFAETAGPQFNVRTDQKIWQDPNGLDAGRLFIECAEMLLFYVELIPSALLGHFVHAWKRK
jgi:hypothetical protein